MMSTLTRLSKSLFLNLIVLLSLLATVNTANGFATKCKNIKPAPKSCAVCHNVPNKKEPSGKNAMGCISDGTVNSSTGGTKKPRRNRKDDDNNDDDNNNENQNNDDRDDDNNNNNDRNDNNDNNND